MTGGCPACHTTAGWTEVAGAGLDGKFDHGRTSFPLSAAHARAACAVCHDARAPKPAGIRITWAPGSESVSFGRPVFTSCTACHVDRHDGVFNTSARSTVCTDCHGAEAWIPTTYDITRHNAQSRFILTGAHQAVPCNACHAGPDSTRATVFRIAVTACVSCHQKDDPHQGQFAGRMCESCHTTASFALTGFDHARTRYPLDGAHQRVPCGSCHRRETTATGVTFRRYTPLGTTCRDCHGGT
jgi:hypothetical protein